jgi:uncharacterized protein
MMTHQRLLPHLTDLNRPFWTGGHSQHLEIQYCGNCARYQHPPVSACTRCGGEPTFKPVSGDATVFSFTVNHHVFNPSVPVPYIIAIVELVEQDDLRLPTNLIDCAPEEARIGMPVHVDFEDQGEVSVPVFRPA